MSEKKLKEKANCPVEITLQVIGGKWKILILYFLLEDVKRFGELSRCLGNISATTLSQQLKELEDNEIIIRNDYREIPPKVEYMISPLGKTLSPLLHAMADWGDIFEQHKKLKKIE